MAELLKVPEYASVPELTKDEIIALQMVWKGEADPYQQKLAVSVIVKKLSRANDLLYIPGSFDETAFLNGRAFVGMALMKYLNEPVGRMKQ